MTLRLTKEAIIEAEIDSARIASLFKQKATEAKEALNAIYAERRTTERYNLHFNTEVALRRDVQKYCQWADSWAAMSQNVEYELKERARKTVNQ